MRLDMFEIVNKSHQSANAILRCFVNRNSTSLVRAVVTDVRPLVEFKSVVWSLVRSPHLIREIIEEVQS